jgi:hypothetical protein
LNTITLTFAGLICHVLTTGNIERAVFVNAPTHDAQIAVPAADVMEVRGLIEEPSANPSERVFAINDQHLTLNTGRTERTVADMSFASFVPALAAISDMTGVRDEVEDGVLFEGAHAYLDLQGGRLSADDAALHQAVFTGGRTEITQCLAKQVVYTVETDLDSVALTGNDGAVLRLRPGTTARITNEPPPEFTTEHFDMYSMILKDATFVATPHGTGLSCAPDGTVQQYATDDHISPKGRFAVAANSLKSLKPRPKVPFDESCSDSHYP